jgi:hypothetical protein
LREYHRPREAKGPSVNKGDVVVIAEDNVKRLNWNIGQIEKLLTGRDGNTRAVVVRTIGKDRKVTTISFKSVGTDATKPLNFNKRQIPPPPAQCCVPFLVRFDESWLKQH